MKELLCCNQSTGKVLPLLPLRYQHSASLLGFRWINGRWRNRTPTTSLPYHGFQDRLPSIQRHLPSSITEAGGVEPLQFLTALLCSRQVAVLSAAASIQGCLRRLELPNFLFHKQAPRPLWLQTPE